MRLKTIDTATALPFKDRVWPGFQKSVRSLILAGICFLFVYLFVTLKSGITAGAAFSSWLAPFKDVMLGIHIVCAVPPIVIGLILFNLDKKKHVRAHIILGTVYCVGIWISAAIRMVLAAGNTHGLAAQMGFGLLGLSWFVTTYYAYTEARKKRFFYHRRWMIRSYALTLAAVSIRPLYLFPPSSIPIETWYVMSTWLCWVPNLLAAELYLRVTDYLGRLRLPKRRLKASPSAA